ncbi:hypothetical protein MHU86_6978 [Fragilaria crotonensis]|nr:hypothetical protein MHU86_6978 [Fragilaria crotonensis]
MDPIKRKVSILGNILTSGIMGTIRMVLITTLIQLWYTKEIDFVLAYTQADVECQLYMSIPKGFEVQDHDQQYVLKLKRNVLGKKQAGRVWNQHLVNKLKAVGFI